MVFTVNLQEREWGYRGQQYHGSRHWIETVEESPDLSGRGFQIADSNGQLWTVKSIFSVEKTSKYPGPDTAEYTVYMVNESRALAQLTGYNMAIKATSSEVGGGGRWDPIENRLPIGQAVIRGTTKGVPTGEIEVRIWDTYEPSLDPTREIAPTPTTNSK